ncbi:hypothetical protein [Brasilonema bromeliae]|uniref:Uncharacterized protein n=1 Tax=Brasilonema bromeliae SPC951 TaxID=385972 RepID=A0ABX1P1M9_9CYAN|nr:hypothetical protein [Brasilonema bromeliae]NMG18199.1 hypothetical protein [Brasilonema bromeliae SPC951]
MLHRKISPLMLLSPFSVPAATASPPEKGNPQSVEMPESTPSLTDLVLPNKDKGITKTEVELLITQAIRDHEFRTTVHAIFMIVVVYTAGFFCGFLLFLSQWTPHH